MPGRAGRAPGPGRRGGPPSPASGGGPPRPIGGGGGGPNASAGAFTAAPSIAVADRIRRVLRNIVWLRRWVRERQHCDLEPCRQLCGGSARFRSSSATLNQCLKRIGHRFRCTASFWVGAPRMRFPNSFAGSFEGWEMMVAVAPALRRLRVCQTSAKALTGASMSASLCRPRCRTRRRSRQCCCRAKIKGQDEGNVTAVQSYYARAALCF